MHLQEDTYMPLKTFVHILLFMPQLDYRWSTKFTSLVAEHAWHKSTFIEQKNLLLLYEGEAGD